MDFEIADAAPEDIEEVLAVKDQCWRESYTHLLPAEFLSGDLAESPDRAERWRRSLAHDAGLRLALVRREGRVVGFAGAGPALDERPPAPEQLYTAYLLKEMHGSGAGQAAVERVIGHRPAYLWVFEENPRARAFYAKLGFAPDGAREVHEMGGRALVEIRMVRPAP
ncbi:GNAT family N-acetyltransferase [Sinomonas halotolerans]|uniref:GNAT family N-acetyltransferase n=1 Tax=Sinomonas halotolerans TaxID=1644133 RepID=A0ABU9WXD7_9MICC